ncbi:QWRF motif-containing protein 2-like [Andrographis paniculata]|uniref:QWRF motif-containing protein 2-like n=1 Tax=Andrographis paniculata TaxID=175694 RepID=UPI0021E7C143|nr:QWRF motif-containing protein 2-like [Andrographis paniculata]
MVAAVTGAPSNPQNPKIGDEPSRRSPLLPSEKDNSNGAGGNHRKPKSRVVSSRYMSPSTSSSTSTSNSNSTPISSRRHPSPLISRNSTLPPSLSSSGSKRAVSVDRRRPAAARPLIPDLDSKHGGDSEISAASKLLVTSTRRLSVSFQGEAFSLPVSKAKAAPASPNLCSIRKGTPERRRSVTATPLRGKIDGAEDQAEGFASAERHRWPARNRLVNSLSKSLDCNGGDRNKIIGSSDAIRALQQSMFDETGPLDLGNPRPLNGSSGNAEASSTPCDLTASDSDSVSSGSTSGVQECLGASRGRGMAVPARFWHESNSKLRFRDPGSPLSTSPGSKLIAPPKLKRYSSDVVPLSTTPRTMSSPVRGGVRNASPSRLIAPVGSSPSRGYSPSRIRNAVSTISNNFVETPSVLSFAVDIRRGKVGENRIIDAHLLRLLYNRHLQWQFVNARIEAVLLVQRHSSERNLWNAWITISDLRDAVTKKKYRLQLMRQKLKLASILKGQMNLLEDWASLEKDLSVSMVGAIEALKASTLRLPVVGGATADIQSLKDAIGSAVDVMQAMASSLRPLLPVVDEVNSLATELTKLTAKERSLLLRCTGFLSSLAALQVKHSSLRTHVVQRRGPNSVSS